MACLAGEFASHGESSRCQVCPVQTKTCADVTGDGGTGAGGGAFDCSTHANDIDPTPETITCANQNACTETECCTDDSGSEWMVV